MKARFQAFVFSNASTCTPLRPGTIRWNSKLQSFKCSNDGGGGGGGGAKKNGVSVTLTDGSTLDAALLIGSDGIHSTVRRQLDFPVGQCKLNSVDS